MRRQQERHQRYRYRQPRRFSALVREQEVRRASPNRYWVVMPGEHGEYRVHAADDAETAAAILHGNPPKGGRRNDEAASAARPAGPASER